MGGVVGRLVLIAALAVAGCGSDRGGAAGAGSAGTVVELAGEVTALRATAGATARPLAAGDEIFADDTVTTADDASVTIALAHNGARWSLTGGVSRRVDQAAAWRAAKSASGQLFGTADDDRTAAAGRPAEQTAAEQTATPPAEVAPMVATEKEELPATDERMADEEPMAEVAPKSAPTFFLEESEEEAEPEHVSPPPPPAPERETRDDATDDRKRRTKKMRSKGGLGLRGGGIGSGSGGRGAGPADDAVLLERPPAGPPTELTRKQILATVSQLKAALARCAAQHDGKGKTVKVELRIAPDGRPSSATALAPHVDTPLGRCVVGVVERARFPKAAGETKLTYPFAL